MVLEVFQNKWVRAVGLLGALLLLSGVLYLLSAVLVPLFFAFIVAYVFDPVIDKIETFKVKGKHVSRVAAIVTLVGSIVIGSMLLPLFVFSSVVGQATEMMTPKAAIDSQHQSPSSTAEITTTTPGTGRLSEKEVNDALAFREKAAKKLEDWLALDSVVRMLGLVGVDVENPDSMVILRQSIGAAVTADTGDLLKSLVPQWKDAGSSIIHMVGLLGDTFLNTFLFVGNFVLFAFVAIYLLKDYDHIVATCDDLIPHRYRRKTRIIMASIDRQLRSFLRGQVTVCCCLGGMYAIGFLIAGAPFALILALLGALGSFVPYLGLILTIGPAVGLTVLQFGPINWHVGAVLATFAIAQFLEGNFLTPRIVGSQVGLGPVWVILAIMVFSSTLGFAGLLLAVPIAAVLKVLLGEVLNNYRTSDFFSGVDDDSSPSGDTKSSRARKTGPSSGASSEAGRRLKKV